MSQEKPKSKRPAKSASSRTTRKPAAKKAPAKVEKQEEIVEKAKTEDILGAETATEETAGETEAAEPQAEAAEEADRRRRPNPLAKAPKRPRKRQSPKSLKETGRKLRRRPKRSNPFLLPVKRVRKLLTAGVLLALLPSLYSENKISSISEVYWTENDFLRIPEYFTGKEFFGKEVVVRTNKGRAGLYFVLELNHSLARLPENSSVLIRVIRSDHPEAKRYELELPRKTTERRNLAGLNGR